MENSVLINIITKDTMAKDMSIGATTKATILKDTATRPVTEVIIAKNMAIDIRTGDTGMITATVIKPKGIMDLTFLEKFR